MALCGPAEPRAAGAQKAPAGEPAPPPRPPLGDAAERARALFAALVSGEPASALDFFLPRGAFRKIKAAADPDAIYDGLLRAYQRDIRALHAATPELQHASFVRLQLSRRRSWVLPGEEANRLPYWAQRHNTLVYRVGGSEHSLEVRVMIAWQGHWYITHLSEFHHRPRR